MSDESRSIEGCCKIEIGNPVKNAEVIENSPILIALLDKFARIKLIAFLRNSDLIDLP